MGYKTGVNESFLSYELYNRAVDGLNKLYIFDIFDRSGEWGLWWSSANEHD